MSENDRSKLRLAFKDGHAIGNLQPTQIKKVFAVKALGIKDEGGPRRGDLSCTKDTMEALEAAGLPVSLVGLGLEGKGEVSWSQGEVAVSNTSAIEESRSSSQVIAAYNTVDEKLIPDQHLLTGSQNTQAMVEVSRALIQSKVQSKGNVISAALIIGEIKPSPTQTLPEMKQPIEDSNQPSDIIKIGEWTTLTQSKKAA